MHRAICIWLPEWPIQRLIVARPELNSAPLVLHSHDPRRGQRVVACCERARQRGILPGMPLAEVAALSKRKVGSRCFTDATSDERGLTAIQLHGHQAEHDHAALAELAVWCEQFSPMVGLEESDSPTCLLLDVTGLGPLFGTEYQLAELIVCAFGRRGYQVRVGVADTVGAAWALARYGTSNRGQAPFVPSSIPEQTHKSPEAFGFVLRERESFVRWPSKAVDRTTCQSSTALEGHRTENLCVCFPEKDACHLGAAIVAAPPGQSRAALEPLPVEALRLSAQTVQILQQLGVCTLLQLWQLPRRELAARWGKALIQRIDQALGAQPEVIVAHRPPPEFAAEWLLEHPTDRRDALETILTHLTEQVALRLAKSDLAAVQVEAWLEGQTTSRCLQVGLFQPSSNPRHIDDLLRLQLETIQLRQPVQRVRLTVVTMVRITSQQHALWEDAGKGMQRELAVLVDRLSSRLGKEHVFGVQMQAGALPERAYREKPLADIMASRRHVRASMPAAIPAHRPLWLQEPPQPLAMVSVATDELVGDGPPIFFRFQNTRHDVARHWGPERIETGWWRGRSVRRDYYRVETTTGFRFWIFRRLSDDAWFLHGCFE